MLIGLLMIIFIKLNAQALSKQQELSLVKQCYFANDTVKHLAYIKLIDAYKKAGAYQKIINCASNFIQRYTKVYNDSVISVFYYQLQLAYYLKGDLISSSFAYNRLHRLQYPDSVVVYYSEVVDLFVLNETGAWQMMNNKLNQLSSTTPFMDSLTNQYFNDFERIKHSAIRKSVIPGLGQYTLGYKKDGINSFLLNSLLIGGTTFLYLNNYYLISTFGALPLTIRLYLGNRLFTKKIIQKKNMRIETDIKNKNKELLKQYLYGSIPVVNTWYTL